MIEDVLLMRVGYLCLLYIVQEVFICVVVVFIVRGVSIVVGGVFMVMVFVFDCSFDCILLDKCLLWWVLINNCWNVSGCRCAVAGVFLVVAVFIIGLVFMVVDVLLVCCLFVALVYS